MKGNKLVIIGIGAAILFFIVIYNMTSVEDSVPKVEQHTPITAPVKIETVTGDSTADSYKALEAIVAVTSHENAELNKRLDELDKKYKALEKKQEHDMKVLKYSNSSIQAPVEVDKGVQYKLKKKQNLLKKKIIEHKKINPISKEESSIVIDKPVAEPSNPSFSFKTPFEIDKRDISNTFQFSKQRLAKKSNALSNRRDSGKKNVNESWLMPIDYTSESKEALKKGGSFKGKSESIKPALTIADNSILYNATALTYLVGRIPVNGRVPDPFPVKVIIGNEALLANGHDLPGVEGMYFSGYATGDLNLRCIRAEMNSYTFIFTDGKQVTYRDEPRTGKGNEEPMAYISDRHGLPCVMGEFVSNVAEFLGIQSGLTGLAAAGEAFAASQVNTGVNALGGSSSVVDGSAGKYALGKVVSGAVGDVSKWVLERQESSFDAVVAPSGTGISLHLNRSINIDYDEAARRIDYKFAVDKANYLD